MYIDLKKFSKSNFNIYLNFRSVCNQMTPLKQIYTNVVIGYCRSKMKTGESQLILVLIDLIYRFLHHKNIKHPISLSRLFSDLDENQDYEALKCFCIGHWKDEICVIVVNQNNVVMRASLWPRQLLYSYETDTEKVENRNLAIYKRFKRYPKIGETLLIKINVKIDKTDRKNELEIKIQNDNFNRIGRVQFTLEGCMRKCDLFLQWSNLKGFRTHYNPTTIRLLYENEAPFIKKKENKETKQKKQRYNNNIIIQKYNKC